MTPARRQVRVVFDSKILLRGVVLQKGATSGGSPRERSFIEAADSGAICLVISEAIKSEFLMNWATYVVRKSKNTPTEIHLSVDCIKESLRGGILGNELLVDPTEARYLRGRPRLDKYINAAIAGEAEYLVTDDPDLLKFDVGVLPGEARNLRICSSAQFHEAMTKVI